MLIEGADYYKCLSGSGITEGSVQLVWLGTHAPHSCVWKQDIWTYSELLWWDMYNHRSSGIKGSEFDIRKLCTMKLCVSFIQLQLQN